MRHRENHPNEKTGNPGPVELMLLGLSGLGFVATLAMIFGDGSWREWSVALGPIAIAVGALFQFVVAQAEAVKRAAGPRAPVARALGWLFVLNGSIWTAIAPTATVLGY